MGDHTSVVSLLSQEMSLLLLHESQENPEMVESILERLTEVVDEWEDRGLTLDPVTFEIITDSFVKQFTASHMAMQTLVTRSCGCLHAILRGHYDEDDDASAR